MAMLVEFNSGRELRSATPEEESAASDARKNGGAGIILVDGTWCAVVYPGGYEQRSRVPSDVN